MTKRELLAALAEFDDGNFLVEGWEYDFDEPTIYVTAARARMASEFYTDSTASSSVTPVARDASSFAPRAGV